MLVTVRPTDAAARRAERRDGRGRSRVAPLGAVGGRTLVDPHRRTGEVRLPLDRGARDAYERGLPEALA